MKTLLIVASLLTGPLAGAWAMEPLAPVQRGAFTCHETTGGLQHVSTAEVGSCCSPHSHCVDLLSTTVLDHTSRANRT